MTSPHREPAQTSPTAEGPHSRRTAVSAATTPIRELTFRRELAAARHWLAERRRLRLDEAEMLVLAQLALYGEQTPTQRSGWGDDIVGRIAQDLATQTGSARGFSRRSLFYMRRFAATWPDAEKVPSVMAQISSTHHRVLLDGFADQPEIYGWYLGRCAENRWSVRQLKAQIDLQLHRRQGAALTNFTHALEPADAAPALQATKDPYIFDFLELAQDVRERELEQALIDDIQKLLLELGTGFAFYGRQKPIIVGGEEFSTCSSITTRCAVSWSSSSRSAASSPSMSQS